MGEQVTYTISLKDLFSPGLDKANSKLDAFENNIDALRKTAKETEGFFSGWGAKIGGALAAIGIAGFGSDVLQTGKDFEGLTNSINFSAGGAEEGAKAFNFLRTTADKLGTDLNASAKGFQTFAAATKGTSLSFTDTQRIFGQVSVAASAMNLSAESSEGVFLALGQMMSKGTVSAEELRGQLGERLPGSFGIAAKAMGVTTGQLDDMLQKGQIASSVFLPRFASELEKTFQGALGDSANSTTANINRLNNDFFSLKTMLFDEAKPAINSVVGGLRDFIGIAKSSIAFVKEHSDTFKILGTVVATVGGGILAYNAYTLAGAAATGVFSGAVGLLNAVMSANPIGLVVAGLGALTAGFITAYKSSQTFRAFLGGTFEVLKTLGNGFVGLGKIVAGTLAFDQQLVTSGVTEFAQAGMKLGSAFKSGFDKTIANEKKQVKADPKPGSVFDKLSGNKQLSDLKAPSSTKEKGLNSAVGDVVGRATKTIIIQIDALVKGGITFQNTTYKESERELKERITKLLLSAVNDFNLLATGQ